MTGRKKGLLVGGSVFVGTCVADELAYLGEPWLAIRPVRDGSYTPAEGASDAIEAFQLPVLSGDELIDVVAWAPDRPEVWWRAFKRATHLGDHCLWRPTPGRICPQNLEIGAAVIAERWQPRVLLVETPADYLANRGDHTVCVLDWARADLVELFDGIGLVFASERLQLHFQRARSRQERP